ncbi:malto-oligosyltrehalose trehalohydrolase [Mycobacteroides abscessus subsp. abscessus]|uniref:malto-oligosyltrehalose trehalohydrolase n=1 Tax=Dermabacter TaxID=36739 RepID=UPI000925C592|nr:MULTISPECIES: malto-oligosyltrehalose trehalohydrolase [Dermabacter]MCG7444179.1 malto-oligosyltrehalose trehalohydrolase [Dermabacter vaginalis]RUP87043.1 malto-oligosyltrehalose trehalohydrolase [Dermabacter sp. HSID17554]SHV78776.1 malto-oligosyltrehalose trehalohydrolase [Mycobacteroides abscessus subsp. abscessus]
MRDYSRFEVWAPNAREVALALEPRTGTHRREIAMERGDGDWWHAPGLAAQPGDRYGFLLNGSTSPLPDPRSLSQPEGVHGLSEVFDPRSLSFTAPWKGMDVRGKVIYELHIGTFAADRTTGTAGTFDSAIARLDQLSALGVNAVEIMPIAAFPGERGWGYDGVGLYATHEAYGGPAALARFVDAAHARGLAVILDVVYNHLGPDGNYLGHFGPYFTDTHSTPWGPAVNLDADGSSEVRAFIIANARQWLRDFHLDGLRLDAVHALRDDSPTHILAELSRAVECMSTEAGRPLSLIAESDLNDPATVTPVAEGGLGMHAQWADDIHHHLHAWASGEREGYYVDFGEARGVKKSLERIFEHDGSFSTFRGKTWGQKVDPASGDYNAHAFVAFIQDHDQVGNRAAGDRLTETIGFGTHAALASLYLLGATTPMVFMGEEWGTKVPFAFFSDHGEEIGPLVSTGRREEFARMGWGDAVPDPQARTTFEESFLDWSETQSGEHAALLEFYRTLLTLRREHNDFQCGDFASIEVEVLTEGAILMHRGRYSILASRGDAPVTWQSPSPVRKLASFGGAHLEGESLTLEGAGALVCERSDA